VDFSRVVIIAVFPIVKVLYAENGRVFNLETDLKPVGVSELLRAASKVSPNIALYLPKTTPMDEVM